MPEHKAPFDGREVSIIAVDTDVDVLEVPEDKVMTVTNITISNNNAAAARVRLWDTFTDSGGTVHSSAAVPVKIRDIQVAPGETVEYEAENGLAKAMGTIVAQSDVGAAFPNDVIVGVWGRFEI